MPDSLSTKIEKLRTLEATPDAQRTYAVRLLKDRTVDVVLAAVAVLAEAEDPAFREPMLAAYAALARDGVKRDLGGSIRIALLDALRPIADSADSPIFERAATTYEFLYGEEAADLRAAGVRALVGVDAPLACFYAMRLLDDRYQSEMSGEPSLTAMRVLAAQGQHLPVYAYVMRETPRHPDVVAEGLRSLVALPPSLMPELVERYREDRSEIVLLGFFDLLLGHREQQHYRDVVLDLLATTHYINLYRYLLILLVNRHDPDIEHALARIAERETDRRKQAIWDEMEALWRS